MSRRRNRGKKRRATRQRQPNDLTVSAPFDLANSPSQMMVNRSVSQTYSGPIPPPDFMRQYDEIIPGAADRILKMAEQQTQHRLRLESQALTSAIRRSWGGLFAGFAIAVLAIGGGIYLAVNGHDIAGTIIGGAGLASLVGVFIYGTSSVRSERETKNKAMRRR